MRTWQAIAVAALVLASGLAEAQMGGSRRPADGPGGGLGGGPGKGPGGRSDDPRPAARDVAELVNLRLGQLEEDLLLTPAQAPQWKAYRAAVIGMLDDVKRGTATAASETTAPKRLDAIADVVRNRLAAAEEIVDAGKALYGVLTPAQRQVADRRLALPLATLLGSDTGADLPRGSPAANAGAASSGGLPPGTPPR